jgi:hypothetical protein
MASNTSREFCTLYEHAYRVHHISAVASYWLINVDELDRISATRMATLKNKVQLSCISLKRAHRG